MDTIALDSYFQRIGFGGPARPDLATLAHIHRLHSRAIAFENLNPWLGMPVPLDIGSLQHKLIDSQRGGFCYEHNLLLAQVLRQIGFPVMQLAARVLRNTPPGVVRARTHMLLLVEVDGGRFAVDGGFGGMTPTGPLQLGLEGPQATPLERYRLLHDGDQFITEAEVAGDWAPLYRFDLNPQIQADYELTSWYLCHHPESHFLHQLVVARTRADGRDTLLDNELTHHRLGRPSEKRVIASADELRTTLETVFGLRLPDVPQLQRRLQQVANKAVQGATA